MNLTAYKRLKKGATYYYYKCNTTGCGKNRNTRIIHSSFKELLSKYKLPKKYKNDFKTALINVFNEMNEVNKEKRRILNRRKSEKENEYEKLERKHVFENLSFELFEKYGSKLKTEIDQIEEEIKKTNKKLSNSSKFIDFSLELLMNTNKVWEQSNTTTKKSFQKLVFPKGVLYDFKNDNYRTDRVNAIFELSNSLSVDLIKIKKRQISKNDNLSLIVAGTGLEPVTFGL